MNQIKQKSARNLVRGDVFRMTTHDWVRVLHARPSTEKPDHTLIHYNRFPGDWELAMNYINMPSDTFLEVKRDNTRKYVENLVRGDLFMPPTLSCTEIQYITLVERSPTEEAVIIHHRSALVDPPTANCEQTKFSFGTEVPLLEPQEFFAKLMSEVDTMSTRLYTVANILAVMDQGDAASALHSARTHFRIAKDFINKDV